MRACNKCIRQLKLDAEFLMECNILLICYSRGIAQHGNGLMTEMGGGVPITAPLIMSLTRLIKVEKLVSDFQLAAESILYSLMQCFR